MNECCKAKHFTTFRWNFLSYSEMQDRIQTPVLLLEHGKYWQIHFQVLLKTNHWEKET